MNKIFLSGNLTKDPDLYENPNGNNFCKFSIAVRRNFKNKDGEYDTDFFNCIVSGEKAQYFNECLMKGDKVFICGSIQNGEYTDKDGIVRKTSTINVDKFDYIFKNKKEEQQAPQKAKKVERKK